MSCEACEAAEQLATGRSQGTAWMPPDACYIRVGAANVRVIGCLRHLAQLTALLGPAALCGEPGPDGQACEMRKGHDGACGVWVAE